VTVWSVDAVAAAVAAVSPTHWLHTALTARALHTPTATQHVPSTDISIHRVTATQFLHTSCFPPFCGASSAKCLLFWRQ